MCKCICICERIIIIKFTMSLFLTQSIVWLHIDLNYIPWATLRHFHDALMVFLLCFFIILRGFAHCMWRSCLLNIFNVSLTEQHTEMRVRKQSHNPHVQLNYCISHSVYINGWFCFSLSWNLMRINHNRDL